MAMDPACVGQGTLARYVLVGAKLQGCINAGKLYFRDDSSRGPRKIVRRHIVSRRHVTPPKRGGGDTELLSSAF